MPTARTRANRKYNEKAYDRITLTVPKGQREVLSDHARERGLSLNAFINTAIADKVKDDAPGDIMGCANEADKIEASYGDKS